MTTPTPRRRRDRGARGTWWTLRRRRYLYGLAAAAVPVAVSYGLVSGDQTVPLLALAAAVLGTTGTALANPTPE
ncbi:hypothetical protein [Leucobacter sp. GX0328]